MSDPRFLQDGFDKMLSHAIEECGEFIAAAGKLQRWGPNSTNPLLPVEQRETNLEWVAREMQDVREAFDRLQGVMHTGGIGAREWKLQSGDTLFAGPPSYRTIEILLEGGETAIVPFEELKAGDRFRIVAPAEEASETAIYTARTDAVAVEDEPGNFGVIVESIKGSPLEGPSVALTPLRWPR